MEDSKHVVCCKSRLPKFLVILIVGILLSVFVTLLVHGNATEEPEDKYVQIAVVLFRHGEKNPGNFYPNDPHAKLSFLGGPGALTMKGSLQTYNLGKKMFDRYMNLLPNPLVYTDKRFRVTSSAAERCIMSAQSFMAGLLPVTKKTKILPIPWQPAAVTTIPRLEDTLIAQKKPCAKYDAMLKDIYMNPPWDLKKMNEENQDIYKQLSTITGKNISTVLDVEFLYNTLKAEEDLKLKLPEWTHEFYPTMMLPLVKRSYTLFTDNDYMKRVKGGAFLGEVQRLLMKKVNKLDKERKMYIYSGHDVTLVNVMNSMGILDQTSELPEYASALVFELHSSPENFEVRMCYFKNSEAEVLKKIEIPNCPTPCSLEDFNLSIKPLLFDDYDELCENPKKC